MSIDNFPLCRRAGLRTVTYVYHESYKDFVFAKDIEEFLSKAPVVYRNDADDEDEQMWTYQQIEVDSHQARLVMIEPIQKDTAESLLRELLDAGNLDSYFKKKVKSLLGDK